MKRVHEIKKDEINLIDSILKSAINKKNEEGGSIKFSDLDKLFSDDGQKSDQTII